MISLNWMINHLWQSTLFAAVVALLSLALRKNQARWRGRLWLAASLKFLVPFSILAEIGSRLGWRSPHAVSWGVSIITQQSGEPFVPVIGHQAVVTASPAAVSMLPAVFLALWICGFAAALYRWWKNWRPVAAAVRAAVSVEAGRELEMLRRIERAAGVQKPIRMLSTQGRLEPGVFGIFRPVLLWPAGISERLADGQMEAILAHEVCHVRRRDNLASALHTVVEAIFWFHPLVWWLGARLVDERENACDEEVLLMGSEPETYAEGILRTCRFYVESPCAAMAGVTGSDLKKRIERIMARRIGRQLDWGRKLLLAAAGIAALTGPIVFGVASAPAVRAQSQPAATPAAAPAFEVASIKPNHSDDHRAMFQITPGGRVNCTNISPKMLIMMAYSVKPNQLAGGPNWLDSEKYDLDAKADGPDDQDRLKLMMRTLLADRFKLAVHRETKDMPIYNLVAAKGGLKIKPLPESGDEKADQRKGQFRMGRGQMNMTGASMEQLADSLSRVVGRNVYDRTSISGSYDIKLEWTPEEGEFPQFKDHGDGHDSSAAAPETTGPSIFAALQDQLGLRMEAAKGPVEILVIDHIEKASEN